MTNPLIRFFALLTFFGLTLLPLTSSADDTIYTKVDENPVPVKTPPPVAWKRVAPSLLPRWAPG